jgi:hypothetical protein
MEVTATAFTANGWRTSASTAVTVGAVALPPLVITTAFDMTRPDVAIWTFSTSALPGATKYHWNFDDGGVDTTWLPTVQHGYTEEDEQRVTVTAVDANGRELSSGAVIIDTKRR